MRTTLDLDEAAIQAAMAAAPGRTRTDLINEALVEFARRRRLARFADLRGTFRWEGDLDELRSRKAPRRSARKR
jgi:hypothetical protein